MSTKDEFIRRYGDLPAKSEISNGIEQTAVSSDKKTQVKWEDVSNSAGDARFQDIWQGRELQSGPKHDKICTRQALTDFMRYIYLKYTF